MNELVGPRSFILTAKGFITGDLKPSTKTAERLYQCIECGACNVKCPPGVRIEEIVRATRNQLIKSGTSPPKNIQALIDSITYKGRLYTSEKDEKSTQNFSFDQPIKEKADILYYIGCSASQLERKQAKAMIKILQKAQVNFTVLKEELCCGLPLLIFGFEELFIERAEKNTEMFKQLDASTIVTTCPGCYRVFSELYPKVVRSLLVQHSSEFIKRLIENGDIELSNNIDKKITYHDPCHLSRHKGLVDPPRNVIRFIPHIEFVEAKRNLTNTQCCGAGAGFALAYPEIAKKICTTRLRRDIEPIGAEILVSSCPNCIHHFKKTIKFTGNTNLENIEVIDLTELVAASLKDHD